MSELGLDSDYEFVAGDQNAFTALGYLKTASVALETLRTVPGAEAKNEFTPTIALYEGTGLSFADLQNLSKAGLEIIKEASQGDKNQSLSPGTGDRLTKIPLHFVPTYKDFDGSITENLVGSYPTKGLMEATEDLPSSQEELDSLIAAIAEVLGHTPAPADQFALLALAVVKLAQVLGSESGQQLVQADQNYSEEFRQSRPINQAYELIVAMLYGSNTQELANTLVQSFGKDIDKVGGLKNAMSELHAYETVSRVININRGLINILGTMFEFSVNQAASHTQGFIDGATQETASIDPNMDEEGLMGLAEVEDRVGRISGHLAEITKSIVDAYRVIVRRSSGVDLTDNFVQFPTARRPVADLLRRRSEEKAAEELKEREHLLALGQAALAENKQCLRTELEALRSKYIMTKSRVKECPGSSILTGELKRGEIGNQETRAQPVEHKDDAYDIAGLLYTLELMLSREDKSTVFDELFSVVEREKSLVLELNEPQRGTSLDRSVRWLTSDTEALELSEIEMLNKIGAALKSYLTDKKQVRVFSEALRRPISIQTIRALEAIRVEAKQLDIRAFPPGESNLSELEDDALELATRPGRNIVQLEWERLLAIDELGMLFLKQGCLKQLFRLLPGSLRERFPYYALVIEQGLRKIVVAENPKKPNATYVFEELDPELAAWEDMVQLKKPAVKDLGGRGMTHSAKSSIDQHFMGVIDEVVSRLTAA